jgi:pimeloyl-ACP methyl ester carboxylesterase
VKAHVDYLKRQKETDKKKIILIGHSEGGMIAPMVAASRNDIFASILLAAPGIPIIDLLTEQQGAVLRSSGISQKDVESFLPFFKRMAMAVNTSGDIPSAQKIIEETLQSYLDYAKPAVVASIIGITDEKSKKGYVDEMLNTFTKKWFDYFISYNPEENLSKMKGHVLAINGSKDIQVIADSNLKGIENALIKGGNKNYKILKMEGYNHLFQKCKKCNVAEYAELTETFSEEVMKEMLNWVRNLEEKNK